MALSSIITGAITGMEPLKDRPPLAALLAQLPGAVTDARFDRDELTLWSERSRIVDVIEFLNREPDLQFSFLADITCVDWYPERRASRWSITCSR